MNILIKLAFVIMIDTEDVEYALFIPAFGCTYAVF